MALTNGKRKKEMDKISFVIPCYNNEENIDDLFIALLENEKQFTNVDFEYVMVDDASADNTFEVLNKWKEKLEGKIVLIKIQKNIGSHKAVFKGLNSVSGQCVVVLSADLQDPPELSKPMFDEWKKGHKLVLAIKDNTPDFFSKIFHTVMKYFFVKTAPEGAFDYVLFDQSLISGLQKKSVKNCNLFYRLVELHHQFSYIYYTKQPRKKGKSGWTFSKKLFFFIENIFSYSKEILFRTVM